MREQGLLAPSRTGRSPARAEGARRRHRSRHGGRMWGVDLTAAWTAEGPAAVFIAVDHSSAECVGIRAAARATRFEALEPIRQGVRRHV